MSRQVKRVALDFEWPLSKVWEGFLLPQRLHAAPCPAGVDCQHGTTRARAWVKGLAHLCLMLDDDLQDQLRGRKLHPYLANVPSYTNGARPSVDIHEFGVGLAGREGGFLGHDSIDSWQAQRKLIEAAGLDPDTWGICPTCKGAAAVEVFPGQAAEAESWEPTEPPAGDGWQVWESVSEGSPVTSVFETPEGLARHLVEHPGLLGPGRRSLTFEAAIAWVAGPGWMPSGVGDASGFHTGAGLVERMGEKR